MKKTVKAASGIVSALVCLCMLAFSVGVRPASALLPEPGDWDYGKKYTVINPYEGINWDTVSHIKSALHTHTSNSGVVWNDSGLNGPDALIAGYKKAGFDALVITDHDYVSYPWVNGNSVSPPSNVNSPDSGLLTVPGNELSKNAHTLSYGTRYTDSYDPNNIKNQSVSVGYDQNIINVANTQNIYGDTGGILYLAHPRRNDPGESKKESSEETSYSDKWWLSKFMKYPQVKGMEVLNCGQFSNNHSERLWDRLLSQSMPDRPIWGTASDDNHGATTYGPTTNLGTGWTQALVDKPKDALVDEDLYRALSRGTTYFSTYMMINNLGGVNDDNKPRPTTPQPKIHSISVDNTAGTITVVSDYTEKVEWISGVNEGNTQSLVIKTDRNSGGGASSATFTAVFDVEAATGIGNNGYVRIRLVGDGGQTHAQPFALKPYYRTLTVAEGDYSVDYANETISISDKIAVSTQQSFQPRLNSGDAVTPGMTLYMVPVTDIAAQECVESTLVLPARPEKPKAALSSRNDAMITLSGVKGGEYRIKDKEWQDSSKFTGLAANTEYTFEVRVKATSTSFASVSDSVTLSTKEKSGGGGCGKAVLPGSISAAILAGIALCVTLMLVRRKKSR